MSATPPACACVDTATRHESRRLTVCAHAGRRASYKNPKAVVLFFIFVLRNLQNAICIEKSNSSQSQAFQNVNCLKKIPNSLYFIFLVVLSFRLKIRSYSNDNLLIALATNSNTHQGMRLTSSRPNDSSPGSRVVR